MLYNFVYDKSIYLNIEERNEIKFGKFRDTIRDAVQST